MKVIVRWTEEFALEVETDDPTLLIEGLPDLDLSYATCINTKHWTWEEDTDNVTIHPLKQVIHSE